MRRVRVPSRRGGDGGGPQLPAPAGGGTALVPSVSAGDRRYLEQVVAVPYSLRSARTYLQRHMGNRISFRLVEVRRGETAGVVREIEIKHADGGERSWIRGERTLPTGEPASFFVPDHLVTVRPKAEGALARGRSLQADDQVVLHLPVRGYLRFLPQIFQGEGPVASRDVVKARGTDLQRWRGMDLGESSATEVTVDEDPLRRFLFLFQHVMSSVTEQIDRVSELTDPLACEARFLPWLASWVGFALDESLPVHQQRELVRRAIRLMRTRGTRHGLEDMVRVLTSAPARVEERARPPAMIIGRTHLIGGRDVVERYQAGEPLGGWLFTPVHPARLPERSLPADEAVKEVYVSTVERRDTSFFTLRLEPRDRFRGRFGERAGHVLRRIVSVLSQERPSHIQFVIRFEDAAAAAPRRAAPKE